MTTNNTQQPTAVPPRDHDVAVIGYGPTGLVAASLLGRAGFKVLVIERWPTPYGLPRLTHIDGEGARIVQACADVDHALRDANGIDSYHYRNAAGELLLALDWKGRSCGFPAHNSIYQPDIEEAIHQRVATFPNVTVLRGWEAETLKQDDQRVTLTAKRTGARDAQWTEPPLAFTARYVIGADGANSFVRRSLGIERFDYGGNERWLNLDSEQKDQADQRFKQLTIFCDPARSHMYMPIGTRRTRFELRVLPGEETAFWEDASNGWDWLEQKHGLRREEFQVLRNVVYTFETRMAQRWREGRVLLGGDAAHTMMPYMGQGACSGMRDGINLAWKLDLVLSGRCAPALLDSYEQERRPHAKQIMEMSLFLGQVTNEGDPQKAAARDEAFRTRNVPPMPAFPKIEDGVLHREADGGLRASTGALAPQGLVRCGDAQGRLDDVVGHGFMLVSREDPRVHLSDAQQAFLAQLGCRTVVPGETVVELDGALSGFMDAHGLQAYIARPDFVVFGSVDRLAQLPVLVDDLRTRLHWWGDAEEGAAVTAAAQAA